MDSSILLRLIVDDEAVCDVDIVISSGRSGIVCSADVDGTAGRSTVTQRITRGNIVVGYQRVDDMQISILRFCQVEIDGSTFSRIAYSIGGRSLF